MSLLALPVELLQLVLGLLGFSDLALRLRPVCRQARMLVVRQAAVAHTLEKAQLGPLLRGLDLSRLVSLTVSFGTGATSLEELDAGCLSTLDALSISGRTFSDSDLENLLRAAPRVETLKLEWSYGLTADALEHVGRLPRLRCLWWPRSLSHGLQHLPAGQLTEFGVRAYLNKPECRYISTCGAVFRNVQVLHVNDIDPPGQQVAGVLAHMPHLRLLHVNALLFGSSLQLINAWAEELFEVGASLERVEARSTFCDKFYLREYLKRDGLRLWLRERGRVQFYAEYGPDSAMMPWLAETCRPLGELVS